MSLASLIQYTAICDIYEKIYKARGNKKIDELRKFIDQCRHKGKELKTKDPDADVSLFPIMRLFLPTADRERGAHGLKEKALAALFVRVLCLGKNSPMGQKLMNYKSPNQGESGMGDFAEKLYWVLKGWHGNIKCTLNVEEVNAALDNIARLNAENQSKDQEFVRLVKLLGQSELKWLTRTILKDLKLGMGQKKVFDAYHPDADNLFGDKSNLRAVCDMLIDPSYRVQKDKSSIVVLSPFKPMLLERCKIEDVGKFFADNQSYFVQTKYDGERSQIHMKNGKFKYYTRHGTDITDNWAYGSSAASGGFLTKKILELLSPDCRSIILDGELMGYNKDRKTLGSKGMPFDVKKLTAKSRHQPCFVAFDIVMYNDQLLVNVPYKDRLPFLDTAFRESEGVLLRSTITSISTSAELLSVFNQSIDTREEGIVLKRSDGLYKANTREGSGCYKIKAEYSDALIQDIDLIILGGYYGEGKCAGMFNSFLMGVSGTANDQTREKFSSVVSVSTGLSMEKLRELEEKFKPHWTKDCPSNVIGPKKNLPDAWIHPKNSVILQLRATELTRCNVHPAGYTLRFPRVVRVRDDKPWEDAWTLRELRAMVKDGGFVQKATKRHATDSDICKSSVPKGPRITGSATKKVDPRFLGILPSSVSRITRLLHGKEFCVINGEENLAKEDKLMKPDVERILHAHAAKVVQNPGQATFAVIVGNPNTERVKNLVNAGKWDVVKLDWLLRATEEKNWKTIVDWYPWEVISATTSTEERLAKEFDEFEDSFAIDADEESLKRSLKLAGALLENSKDALKYNDEIESQLFDSGISPFSLFRHIVGYFEDSSDHRSQEFTFMRGTIKEAIDATLTHVFVNCSAHCLIDVYKKIDECGTAQIKIVNSSWIKDCFERRELLSDDDYIIG